MKRWLPLLWMMLSLTVWAAPGLDIDARVEQPTNPLPFGKPATLVLNLSWDESWPFTPPEADSLDLPGFTVIDRYQTSATPGLGAGRQGMGYNIVFTRFEPGKAQLPALEFQTPSGKVKSKPLEITYKGAEPQEGDKPDQIRGPKESVELSTRDFWRWLAKAVGASLAALLLLTLLLRRLGALERWLSPRGRALRQLKRLSKALDKGAEEPSQLLLDTVGLLRRYLASAHGLVTREATSAEISRQLTLSNRSGNIKPIARAILERGDGAKFARREVSAEEVRDLLSQLRTALQAEKKKP